MKLLATDPWAKKVRWRRKWQLILIFLPGESHGQRSLVGYGPWGQDWALISSNTDAGIMLGEASPWGLIRIHTFIFQQNNSLLQEKSRKHDLRERTRKSRRDNLGDRKTIWQVTRITKQHGAEYPGPEQRLNTAPKELRGHQTRWL